VLDRADLGAARELTLALEGTLELTMRTLARPDVDVGAPVRVELSPEAIKLWPVAAVAEADAPAEHKQRLWDERFSSG
jgi:hypothetical protein